MERIYAVLPSIKPLNGFLHESITHSVFFA